MSFDFNFSKEELDAAESAAANPYLRDPARGLQLIARLTGKPRRDAIHAGQCQLLAELHTLIHEHFIALTAKGSYPGEAQALRELQALEEALENLALFPDLANKTVVGVGGGFSAGKSRFLNTLLGVDLLPESLEPTTAIPSFITRGEDGIVALNTFNQQVPLDKDALQAITHAFANHYRDSLDESFGFAHVLKLLMLHHADIAWHNLAFLDTPGYSKADAQNSKQTDEGIALKQLSEADHLLWLLNAKNGSIRQDDLQFLRTLGHDKPVFFVITQADLVGKTRIADILQSTRAAIDDAGIPCAGLMAWAAPFGAERGEQMGGDNIRQWLDELDAELKFTTHRLNCERVLDGYIRYHREHLAGSRQKLTLLNTLLPLTEQLPESERSTLRVLIQEQRHSQQIFAEQVEAFAHLKTAMLGLITQVVSELANDAASSEEIFQQALLHHEEQRYAVAFTGFRRAAEMGHAAAQFNLGVYHAEGLGIAQDLEQPVIWYRKAAEQGHANAQFNLGIRYDNGIGVPKDARIAACWYRKAAEQGQASAQYNLGICYANGEGVTRDEQKAIDWFRQAAEQNHPQAQFYLQQIAALSGDRDSQYALAICYEQGRGVEKDIDKAIAWYRQAAEQGHRDAQFELGRRYQDGDGLKKHPVAAQSWLEKSAKQGHKQAEAILRRQSLLGDLLLAIKPITPKAY